MIRAVCTAQCTVRIKRCGRLIQSWLAWVLSGGSTYIGHPLAQRPHILGLLGLKDPKNGFWNPIAPQFRGTLDVVGYVVIGSVLVIWSSRSEGMVSITPDS